MRLDGKPFRSRRRHFSILADPKGFYRGDRLFRSFATLCQRFARMSGSHWYTHAFSSAWVAGV
jgi:hypothetical protein